MDFFMLISLIRKVNIITDDSYQVMPELNSISTGIHHHELTFTIPVLFVRAHDVKLITYTPSVISSMI